MNELHTITINNLSKTINGTEVLNNINLTVKSGCLYGFVGKNGSGKSMLFRALSGLIRPTSGKILIDGKELHKDIKTVGRLGIIIENAGLYPEFTGYKNLQLLAKVNKIARNEEIIEAITRVGLDPHDKRTVKKYSLGMRQRIVIAQAIMEKPDFLFLDEPTNALDESGVELVHNIIKEEVKRGALVLLSSHSKEDIENLCDKKYIMAGGKLIEGESL